MSEILRKIKRAREAWELGKALHADTRPPGRIGLYPPLAPRTPARSVGGALVEERR